MQQVHDIKLLIMVNVIQAKGNAVEGGLHILLLQELEALDEPRKWDLGLVDAITEHEIEHLPEIGTVITEDILQISDDVRFSQIATLLYKFWHELILKLFLIRIVIQELLENLKELCIVLLAHPSAYSVKLRIKERSWTYFPLSDRDQVHKLRFFLIGLFLYILGAVRQELAR